MNHLTWWEAAALARAGIRVRRAAWRTRWVSWQRGLFWLTPVNPFTAAEGASRVVRAADWSATEFRARDWTTEPIPAIDPQPVAFPPFELAIVRYRWAPEDGQDLDTLTALLQTGEPAVDGIGIGFANPVSLPAGPAPWIQWGGDNTSDSGVEAVAIDFDLISRERPAAEEIRVRLQCYWFGDRRAGDVTIAIDVFAGGGVAPSGGNDLACSGEAVHSAEQTRNVTLTAATYDPAEILVELVWNAATREAYIEEPR